MSATSNRLFSTLSNSRDFGLPSMDRLFDQLLDGVQATAGVAGWSAPWASWEDEGHVYLEIELPGVKGEHLELVAYDGTLRLKGERKAPDAERKYRYNNRRFGKFERLISLPETVDAGNVTAEMRDGVLYVKLAKLPEAQPKRIAVQTG
jgi:HSP20 family protein